MTSLTDRGSLHELTRESWDVLVIGGGITGAGVFREAARLGMKTLLVERADFASGTSSHSAKLIHGGLHYFARGQVGLALEAVRERERLLQESTGLIDPLEFILPLRDDQRLHNYVTAVGLGVYEAFGGRFHRPQHVRGSELAHVAPGLERHYADALRYTDAQTDDARLVLRVIMDGRAAGGAARNYVEMTGFTRDGNGNVTGAWVHDVTSGETDCVRALRVVNATGPWSDDVRGHLGHPARQRLVRGSHIVLPHSRLPIATAMAVYHVDSGLPLYLVPWRGTTLVGTTHIETSLPSGQGLRASDDETAYLLRGAQAIFPERHLTSSDVQSTFAGLRPIVDTHATDPARASRDFGIWEEDGLVTVTGGKLTTFRAMARDVMKRVAPRTSRWVDLPLSARTGNGHAVPDRSRQNGGIQRRLNGLYGDAGSAEIRAMPDEEQRVELYGVSLAEIRWAARAEDVVHLDDLLFRRVRLGLTAPAGGAASLDLIEPIARQELGWDEARWTSERAAYERNWRELYAPAITPAPLFSDSPG